MGNTTFGFLFQKNNIQRDIANNLTQLNLSSLYVGREQYDVDTDFLQLMYEGLDREEYAQMNKN